jgi:hypothetical protein
MKSKCRIFAWIFQYRLQGPSASFAAWNQKLQHTFGSLTQKQFGIGGMIFSPSLTLGKCIAFNPQMVDQVLDPIDKHNRAHFDGSLHLFLVQHLKTAQLASFEPN